MNSPKDFAGQPASNVVADLRKSRLRPRRSMHALESRIVFDGALPAAVDALAHASADPVVRPDVVAPAAHARTEIIFVESDVADYQTLLNGVDPGAEVHVLDASQDGLAQIAGILDGRSGIDAIHIVSHGEQGSLQLGTLTLTGANLRDHAADLATIGSALDANADILLYGCNVAAGSDGAALIDALAQATQADIAASTDMTGAAARGGDWQLEYAAGRIDAAALNIAGYGEVLLSATFDYEPGTGSVSGVDTNTLTQTNTAAGETLRIGAAADTIGNLTASWGESPLAGSQSFTTVSSNNFAETSVNFSLISGNRFSLGSIMIGDLEGNPETLTFTSSRGSTTVSLPAYSGSISGTTFSFAGVAAMQGITSFMITSSDGTVWFGFDNIVLQNIAPPTVTDGNISINGGSGPGGAYRIGDTVTATWNNTAGGDNNAGITAGNVTMDFSAFGGGSAVVATNSGGTWTATYLITAGSIDATNRNVAVTATGSNGSVTTTADTTNATVDNQAPTVSDTRISISGGSGTGGAYRIGDTVTATWNNTAAGDNNADIPVGGVTMNFSAFGGGSAVTASNSGGTWTATYTIVAGAIDGTNRNVSVTATDNAGNATTTADTTNATVDNIAPTITDPNISISGGSGPGGAYRIGDTVTATWNNTAGGDNNADTISGATVNFSAFGGGSAVAASNSGGTWTATYTIVAGAIDGTNRNVSVTATDNAGNTTTTADTTNATVDNIAPTVTDAKISISGATGAGGAFKIGDTVTATWNNTAGGDNNADTISGVTMDFSAFGGGSAVVASNSGGTWTATYTIVAGAIDGTGKNVSVTATDNAGNTTTTADTTNATVDNIAPTVTDTKISISGGSGPGGAYRIGDTVTATWNNTAGGDNNADTISGVTVNFSAFGGGAAVAATNSGGTWTATYTIVAGAIDGTGKNVSVTATDNAGNTTTTADTTNATVDNIAPTVTDAKISISGGSGPGGAYRIGDTVTATWNNTAGGDNNADTISGVTVNFSAFGGGAAVAATNSGGTWTATYFITPGAIDATNRNVSVTATDNAGNATTTADTTNATVDSIAPTISFSGLAFSDDTGTDNTDFITKTATQTITATLSAGLGAGDTVWGSLNGGTTWTDLTGQVSGTTLTWTGATLSGANTLQLKVTDDAGNVGTMLSQSYVLDTTAPTTTVATMFLSADTGASGTDFITATAAQTISGTLSAALAAGEIVEVSLDSGTTWTTATATVGQTTWSLAGQTLAGSNTLQVRVTDLAGNPGPAASRAYVLDQTAPTTTVASIAFSADTGTSSSDFITATAAQTISGTLSANLAAGEIVQVSLDNGSTWTTATAAVGSNTWSLAGQTLTGSNTLQVRVSDTAGNPGPAASRAYVLDTVAPTITFSGLGLSADTGTSSTDFITATAAQTITATLSAGLGAGDTVWGSLDNGATWSNITGQVSGTALAWTGATLSGANTLQLKVTDVAGNDGAVAAQAYVLATTVPTTTVATMSFSADTGTSSTDFITRTAAQTISGTLSAALAAGEIVEVSLNNGATWTTATATVGQTTWSLSGQTLVGSHTLQARVTSLAGLSGTAATQAYVLDQTAPATTVASIAFSADTGTSSTDFVTATAAQTITATLSAGLGAGDTVWGSLDNGATWSNITAQVSGTTLTWTGVTLSGANTLQLKVADRAGNDGTVASQAYVLDQTAPAITFSGLGLSADTGASSTDFITKTAAQTITATLSAGLGAGDTVWGSLDNGATWSDLTAKVSGTTLTWNGVTLSGANTLQLKVTDVAGNDGAAASKAYVLDQTVAAPTLALAADTGSSAVDAITSNGTVNVVGLETGASWQYSEDGGTTWNAGIGSSFTLTGDGAKSVVVRQTDTAGNVSASSAALPFILDTTAAAPTLTLAADTGSSAVDTITSNGTVNVIGLETGASWQYSEDGGATWTTGIGSSFTLTGDGAKSVVVRQTDSAGNASASSAALPFILDTTAAAPTLALAIDTGSSAVDTITSNGTVNVAGLEPGASWQYSDDGGTTWIAGTGSSFTVTGDGAKLVVVRQIDVAGNVSASSAALPFKLDTTAPTNTMTALSLSADTGTSAADFITNTAAQTISGTLAANLAAGEFVEVSLDNGATWVTATAAVGQNTWSLAGQALVGSNTLQVRVADAAGNKGPATVQPYELDTVVPGITFSGLALSADTGNPGDFRTLTAQQTITATLSAGLGAGDTVWGSLDNGATWTNLTAQVSGTTLTWSGATLLGNNTLKLKVTDNAGNDGAVTSQAYGRDVVPPVPPTPVIPPAPTTLPDVTLPPPAVLPVSHALDGLLSTARAPAILIDVSPTDGVSVETGQTFVFSLPKGVFFAGADAQLTYQASLADGGPLPNWLRFDPKTGTFSGVLPKGEKGPLQIRVKAVDNKGNEAVTTFTLKSGVAARDTAEPSQGPRASAPSSGAELLSLLGIAGQPEAPADRSAGQPAEASEAGSGESVLAAAQAEAHALRLSAQLEREARRFAQAREATLRHLAALEQAG